MKLHNYSWLIFLALTVANSLPAAEISGTVREASGDTATIVTEGDILPSVGDKAEIFFNLPGADDEISVATGRVLKIDGESIQMKIENATGDVAKDQLARITSENPRKRSKLTAAPSVTPPAMVPPLSPAPTPTPKKETGTTMQVPVDVRQMASQTVTFDQLLPGPIAADAFSLHGIRLVKRDGTPTVFKEEPNMVLPSPCQNVLLVGDTHVTSLSIELDPPVKRFSLYRIGTRGGASTPTWKMTAYSKKGKVLGSNGETHGLPAQPMYFGIDAENIARVEISTDNRYGSGTWATWSSLPIAGFGFDR